MGGFAGCREEPSPDIARRYFRDGASDTSPVQLFPAVSFNASLFLGCELYVLDDVTNLVVEGEINVSCFNINGDST